MTQASKPILSALFAALLLLSMAACGIPSGNTEPVTTSAAVSTGESDKSGMKGTESTKNMDNAPSAAAKPTQTEAGAESAETEPGEKQTEAEPAENATAAPAPGAQEETEPTRNQEIDPGTGKDRYDTDPIPEDSPGESFDTYYCTISISCGAILDNMDLCDEPKRAIVPADGVILPTTTAAFSEGESVFDVLQRVCQDNGIHMEYSWMPMYHSAYIEGIANLYEFDVGDGSGWMYKVNEWFPNYGCSRYQVEDGDAICWIYTCDLGYDVGGGYSVG